MYDPALRATLSVIEVRQGVVMNKPEFSPRWYLPWRQGESRQADDPADLGTAFGLELSLTPDPQPKPAGEPQNRTGWMHRLAALCKPAV